MDGDERDDVTGCSDCGGLLSPTADLAYPFGSELLLCMECALRRGGAYDAADDRWTVSPRVDDLLERLEAVEH